MKNFYFFGNEHLIEQNSQETKVPGYFVLLFFKAHCEFLNSLAVFRIFLEKDYLGAITKIARTLYFLAIWSCMKLHFKDAIEVFHWVSLMLYRQPILLICCF